MIDVFIDMTNTIALHFGTDNGARCGMGSALWEIGIPHDRLLSCCVIKGLTEADQRLCDETLPALRKYEGDISGWYDTMVMYLHDPTATQDAQECAIDLMHYGKQAGVNFIIASPLPKQPRIKRQVAELETVGGAA